MIRVLLVDDQSIIRQGLKALLELEPDLQVVGDADNGQSAIQQVEALQPDVVLMDIRMPVMDGIAATRSICQRFTGTKVLVMPTFLRHSKSVQAAICSRICPQKNWQQLFEPFIRGTPSWDLG